MLGLLIGAGKLSKNISTYFNGRSIFYIVVYKPTYGQTFLKSIRAVPSQARLRYYPRLADAKLSLRLTARELLSTEARLSAMRMVHALTLCHRSDDENHTLQKRHNLK